MTWDDNFLNGLILILQTLPSWAVPASVVAYLVYRAVVTWNENKRLDAVLITIPNILNQVNGNVRDLVGRLDTLLDLIVRTRTRRE